MNNLDEVNFRLTPFKYNSLLIDHNNNNDDNSNNIDGGHTKIKQTFSEDSNDSISDESELNELSDQIFIDLFSNDLDEESRYLFESIIVDF